MADLDGDKSAAESEGLSPALVLWSVLSVVFAIIVILVSKNGPIAEASLWRKILGFIVAVPVGAIGAFIGDVFRRFAIPDAVIIREGFFNLVKTRLFWMIGPQLIGLCVGVILGFTVVIH